MHSSERLAPDAIRTVLAAIIGGLTLGGWVYGLFRPDVRHAIGAQSGIWWLEQSILLAQAVLCLVLTRRYAACLLPVLAVTAVVVLFGILHWVQAVAAGEVSLPVTLLVNIGLMWRLKATRRARVPIDAPAA